MSSSMFIHSFGLIIMLMLSSCGLQKRRYSGGYYIDLQTSKGQPGSRSSYQPKSQESAHGKSEKEKSAACASTEIASHSIAERGPGSLNYQAKQRMVMVSANVPVHRAPDIPGYLFKDQELSPRKLKGPVKATPKPGKKNEDLKDGIDQKRKRRAALIIGISLLLMAAIAIFAAPAISGLFVLAEPALTALNVAGAMGKFRAAIISWIVIFFLDVLISIGVYNYYKKEKPLPALGAGLLRLVYSAFLGVGIVQLLRAASAPQSAIYGFLNSFHHFWSWGLIVFGLHLMALGILYHNEGGKTWINISIKAFLIVAGIGYMALNIGLLIVPNPVAFAALIEPIFLVPQILGEVFFALWMLAKGGKQNAIK